jgi:uncharacterized Zn-binding protein involved in type VI secretion
MNVSIKGHLVALVGQSSAGGGLITGEGAESVTVGGFKVALDGDSVAAHGVGTHAAAHVTASHNQTVFIGGKLVIVDGDLATCSHEVTN